MLKLVRVLAAVGIFSALSTAASAQPAVRGMAACRVDLATFCQNIEAGRGKRVACLTQNQDKLAPDCRSAVQQRAAQAPAGTPAASVAPSVGPPPASAAPETPAVPPPALKSAAPAPANKSARLAACRADLQTLCVDAQTGGGGRMRCLQDNQAKLSPACADTLAELKARQQDERRACAIDANQLCPGLKGEPRRACFVDNQAQLSPDCAAVVGRRASVVGATKQ